MDFIILDLICFTASYLMAYALRHGNVGGLFDNIVYINTGMMKERDYAEKLDAECRELIAVYCEQADQVYTDVSARLQK